VWWGRWWIGAGGGKFMLCKPHKVCILLWPMGRDDVRTRADESPFLFGWSRGLVKDFL